MKSGLILVWLTGALFWSCSESIQAYPASDTVICRVTYQDELPDKSTEYNGDEVSVKVSELPKLPMSPPVKKLVAGSFGLPDFKGTIRDETDKETITYEGRFTGLVADELFLPHGTPVVLRPEIYFPARTNDGAPEIYTTTNENGLRAVWLRTPLWGNMVPPIKARYFAVLVQLYDYTSKPVRCHFTGVRIVRTKSFWGGATKENLTDAEIKFTNAPERKMSIYPAISAMHM
jgi:hypothetical protein